ncbi:MAG: hypothetical protein A2010_08445 [Nitrospirae bacterium GWD2_57_9]|nr:MAG: hypothetical protein A2010_08445 [Nitrospirae bacterium GWD2_57_9]
MRKIFFLSTVMLFAWFTPCFAQGPYLGAGFVYNNPLGGDIAYLDPGFGLNFTFGYDFGPVALEGNLMGSEHDDRDPGYGDADFSGLSLDLRIFLSHPDDRNQIYLLTGIGSYSIDEYSPVFNADTELNGSGWNFGAGLEHYVNTNAAVHVGFIYRLIRYDEFEVGNVVYERDFHDDGDTLSFQAGFNFYF